MSKASNGITFVVTVTAMALVASTPALASVETDLFGSSNPLARFAGFVTGPFAFFVATITVVAFGAMLASGNDMSGFSRRISTTILGLAFMLLAVNAINFLFGGNSAGAVLLIGEMADVR